MDSNVILIVHLLDASFRKLLRFNVQLDRSQLQVIKPEILCVLY